jgi:restriction system protein
VKNIFAYEDYIRHDAFADPTSATLSRPQVYQFFQGSNTSACQFCKSPTSRAYQNGLDETPSWLGGGRYLANEYVLQCEQCGWWRIHTIKETDGDIEGVSTTIKNAVMKTYDLSSKEIPIKALQQYLRKNFDDVIHIDDVQMEKLVQSVFSEHFACEVQHVGKVNDGGVDLIFIESNSPIVIQVKRRKTLSHVESVSGIRELLGAALLKESRNCIYVSTCSKFSDPASDTAQRSVELGIVESYELYDFARFSDVLKLTADTNAELWRKYLEI